MFGRSSSPNSLIGGNFDIYNELLNPLRSSQRGFNPSRQSLPVMPAGPDIGFNHKREMNRHLHPRHLGSLPPIPEPRGRDAYTKNYRGNIPLERPRPIHDEGPQNYAQLAYRNYLEMRRKEGMKIHPEEMRRQQVEMEKFASNQKFLADRVERFRAMPLMANVQRNPDLNHFERAEFNLEAMNVDQLRMLKNVPVGTDLYRFKVEQAKETGVVRGEVMKLIEEQRLKDIKKRFDMKLSREDASLQNRLWSDDQTKNIIQKRMREALGKEINLENNQR